MSHESLRALRAIHRRGPVTVERRHPLSGWNRWLAVAITAKVGSMPAAYLFCLLSLISLPAAIGSGNVIVIVGWVAQTFLQLVLLPVIIVGQNVQAAASDGRAETDHEILGHQVEVLATLHEMQEEQTGILHELQQRISPSFTSTTGGAANAGESR